MRNYSFNNKFIFDNKKVMNGILIKLLIVFIIIIAILKLAMDGFSIITICIPLFVISLIIPKGAPTFEEEVSTRIALDNDNITINYMNLDRHDKLGYRNEIYIINLNDIKQVRYNEKYFKLEIISKALITISSSSKETTEKDYRNTDEWCTNVLYLPDDVRNEILDMMKTICNENIYLNEQ